MLGYTPYHMSELVKIGKTHMNCMIEALEAKYHGKGKKYGRKEFDKWFGNYNVRLRPLAKSVAFSPDC